MVWQIIRTDILIIALIFPRPYWAQKNTAQHANITVQEIFNWN